MSSGHKRLSQVPYTITSKRGTRRIQLQLVHHLSIENGRREKFGPDRLFESDMVRRFPAFGQVDDLMQTEEFETPVALFVFRRPDTTRKVFEAIANVRPTRLLLIADGPRPDKPGELEASEQVREIVSRVDWPCEVSTNFADHNLGCQERMISGLNWVFSLVEDAILLEDDCLPDPSFFPFCRELLDRYRGDDRISYISGTNLVGKYLRTTDSYFFSEIGGIWGWATWRSEWQRYDRHLTDWPTLKRENALSEIFQQPKAVTFWTRIFDAMYEKRGPDTWDYQWLYTCLKNHSLAAVSSVNLIANIGFGQDATHTVTKDTRFMLPAVRIEFPLKHPSSFIPLRSVDRYRVQGMFLPSIFHRALRKIRRSAGRLLR